MTRLGVLIAALPSLEAGVRILVVDDDLAVTALLARGLKYEGYAVDVVATVSPAQWSVPLSSSRQYFRVSSTRPP